MLRFPLASDLFQRLPRHPDWKYERVDGEAWISSRPRPLLVHRPTTTPVQTALADPIEIREIGRDDGSGDRDRIRRLVVDVWREEDPYRSFADPEPALDDGIEHGLAALELGAVAVANVPSLRWHLSRGFTLAPDPLREALRRGR